MDAIIKVQEIRKAYSLGAARQAYETFGETVASAFRNPLRYASRRNRNLETLWALDGVSFDVLPGEVVGIIGRNGAGKSTLLKILSRITEPTSGKVELFGRLASLLEVGTGFHPELTGRENIFLNGAILGMRREEIDRKFDEIVAFADVSKFLDTPVKRYSSGMYVRLAFAVAAHLEPEILVIDEVLAVGDASFQRKCLNKMRDVSQQGRTVLFVSHNMAAITRLCERTILLDDGKIVRDGPSHQVVSTYLTSGLGTTAAREWQDISRAPGDNVTRLRSLKTRTEAGEVTDVMDIRKPIGIEMEFEVLEAGHILAPNYHFFNEDGIYLFVAGDKDPAWKDRTRPKGRYVSTAWIPGNLLAEGTVRVGAAVTTPDPESVHFFERDAVAFQVVDSLDADSVRAGASRHIPGVVRPQLNWETNYIECS